MTTFIGESRPERLTCREEHLPGCHNPGIGVTACICGEAWWPGMVGVWHSVPRRAPEQPLPSLGVGVGAAGRGGVSKILGWDTYYLHAAGCPERGDDPGPGPCSPCGGGESSDYHAAVRTARALWAPAVTS